MKRCIFLQPVDPIKVLSDYIIIIIDYFILSVPVMTDGEDHIVERTRVITRCTDEQ